MEKYNEKLVKSYFIKLISVFITGGANTLIALLLPRYIGVQDFGVYVFLQNIFQKLYEVADSGSSIYYLKRISTDSSNIGIVFFYHLYLLATLFLAVAGVVIIFGTNLGVGVVPDIEILLAVLGCIAGFITWLTTIVSKTADAFYMTTSFEIYKVSGKILILLSVLLFGYFQYLDLAKFYILHISFLVVILFLFFNKGLRKLYGSQIKVSTLRFLENFSQFYTYVKPLLVYSFILFLSSAFDFWLLERYYGLEAVAMFGYAMVIASIAVTAAAAMSQLLVREFAIQIKAVDLESLRRTIDGVVFLLFSLTSIISACVLYNAGVIIDLFAREEFQEAESILLILAFYPIHQSLGQLLGSYMYAVGATHFIKNIGILGALVGFIITCLTLLVFDWGASGLAYKIVLVQFISVNIYLWFVCRNINARFLTYFKREITILSFVLIGGYLSFELLPDFIPYLKFSSSIISFLIFNIIWIFLMPNLSGLKKNRKESYDL